MKPTLKSNNNKNSVIGITMGDPCGIGPEIIAKALVDPSIRNIGGFQIIGDFEVFRKYFKSPLKNCSFIDLKNFDVSKNKFTGPNKKAGEASLAYLDTALSLLKIKKISALVTGPVCKEAIQMLDPNFKGHTEYLANFFKVKKFDMMFVTKNLKVIIATRHTPLNEVSSSITQENLYQTIHLTLNSLQKQFKIKEPRIGVCGLNPHAGEGGKIGKEEQKTIIPVIKRIRKISRNIDGPFAADTLFCPFNIKKYDAIIAMYHDQGLIPIKASDFNSLVNLTIGLPIIRTSPAHGTAFDIVGKNKADPSSMIESIRLAAHLSQ
ncbi:MAG: 4-hydroxythreonine-4-phosphate dehydrogenase PdxA [Candidatus Omnitrophica bacterium]|nr:4-hydroxythreonine-4-phosphate dehydrogenase PdxA [Candidatus Omnitrophota bacterium]